MLMGKGTAAWAGFFDACVPGEAIISVTQNTLVKSETASLPGDDFHNCRIRVADGVVLKFDNVRVIVPGDTRLAFEGGAASQLIIDHSNILACDNDIIGFSGVVQINHSELKEPVGKVCDLMEIEPDGDLIVLSSTLRTDLEMYLIAANKVSIQKSTLDATKVSFNNGSSINIGQAPFPTTTSQHTLVEKTDIMAEGGLLIGAQQDTTVTKNDFKIGGTITITGNPCRSQSNKPAAPCS